MRTHVYVDGFNLYYGSLKGTPYRWLNLMRLCNLLLPGHQILKIRYFSAEVKPRPGDPDAPRRQQVYFRALKTISEVEIELGMFLESVKFMPQADAGIPPPLIKVIKTEEKGSDVNLATRLLMDAVDNLYECAVLITNDSDLLTPIKVVRGRFKKVAGILNPQKRPSRTLCAETDFFKQIREGVLAASQFSATLSDSAGIFAKPAAW